MDEGRRLPLATATAAVAHDLNTPLASIKANVEMAQKLAQRLREKPGDERALALLDTALATLAIGAQRGSELVASLRAFARFEDAPRERADLHQGLEATLRLLHHMLEPRIQVERRYGDIGQPWCHAGEIHQLLMNLLVNAAQAIDGEGTIRVTTAADGDDVLVTVADSGKGIAAEHLARVFDPGFTTKAGAGSGLGLAIAQRVAREHGGDLTVVSEPGAGATFTLRLPLSGEGAG